MITTTNQFCERCGYEAVDLKYHNCLDDLPKEYKELKWVDCKIDPPDDVHIIGRSYPDNIPSWLVLYTGKREKDSLKPNWQELFLSKKWTSYAVVL